VPGKAKKTGQRTGGSKRRKTLMRKEAENRDAPLTTAMPSHWGRAGAGRGKFRRKKTRTSILGPDGEPFGREREWNAKSIKKERRNSG